MKYITEDGKPDIVAIKAAFEDSFPPPEWMGFDCWLVEGDHTCVIEAFDASGSEQIFADAAAEFQADYLDGKTKEPWTLVPADYIASK